MGLTETFRDLFVFLKDHDYHWIPQTPEQLLKSRKDARLFPPLVRFFGLGMPFSEIDLFDLGLPLDLCSRVAALRPAVSKAGALFIPHDHWPPSSSHETSFVYYGKESTGLLENMSHSFDKLIGAKIIDLGCGSGALALSLGSLAKEVLGLDIAAKAIVWAGAGAQAQGYSNVKFINEKVGGLSHNFEVEEGTWDAVVFNPPMVLLKNEKSYPHRNGGHLGLELPLAFLDFSSRALKVGGDVFCLATNPIVKNKSILFEKILSSHWKIEERKCLHSYFNQSFYRKEGYAEFGVERVELWYLHLQKRK